MPATPEFDTLFSAMVAGRTWEGMDQNAAAKELLARVFDERYHANDWSLFQARANLARDAKAASYAGWITADNETSGGYQGTSFVWMPAPDGGSVAVLVIGTQGFGADAALLARPGHRRRLAALARVHGGRLWVKADLLDRAATVPPSVSDTWPEIKAALKAYDDVIYAAVAVRSDDDREAVEDLVDAFFDEHGTGFMAPTRKRWERRKAAMTAALFPRVGQEEVARLLKARSYVVLEGPPGTGKTRLARRLCDEIGSATQIQFHPARTYEDFVVGLAPQPAADGGLRFEVRKGDLLRANERAEHGPHVLMIDEINRADLGAVLGEAIQLFEAGETDRSVELPHEVDGSRSLQLAPDLMVIGTRNTADRSVAALDLAIRRRFAFLSMWPDRRPVADQRDPRALACFDDTLHTFMEYADDDALALVPGHAYFLDSRPDGAPEERSRRIADRLRFELLPLLDEYVSGRLVGAATTAVQGLRDRVALQLARPSEDRS